MSGIQTAKQRRAERNKKESKTAKQIKEENEKLFKGYEAMKRSNPELINRITTNNVSDEYTSELKNMSDSSDVEMLFMQQFSYTDIVRLQDFYINAFDLKTFASTLRLLADDSNEDDNLRRSAKNFISVFRYHKLNNQTKEDLYNVASLKPDLSKVNINEQPYQRLMMILSRETIMNYYDYLNKPKFVVNSNFLVELKRRFEGNIDKIELKSNESIRLGDQRPRGETFTAKNDIYTKIIENIQDLDPTELIILKNEPDLKDIQIYKADRNYTDEFMTAIKFKASRGK